jgi:quercetin dioxygenase-like cupin family protein
MAMTGSAEMLETLEDIDLAWESIPDAQEVDAKPWETFAMHEGVKVLWKDEATGSYSGLLGVAPGASLRAHIHPFGVHHVYVLEGTCRVAGEVLTRGSYVFVPPGEDHRIDEAGPLGCTIFFLYLGTPANTSLHAGGE